MSTVFKATLVSAALVVLICSCATGSTARVEYDSEFDFSSYSKFAWRSENPMTVGKSVSEPKESLQPRIMASIRKRLESAGYEAVDTVEQADFLLAFTVGSREMSAGETAVSTSADTAGRGGWATAYSGGANADYAQGMLAIEISDATELRPVWHGMHGMNILQADDDYVNTLIDRAVEDILSNFPPDNSR
jgi:hypothetical protein